jgi:predicted TIM-barrel enzyme
VALLGIALAAGASFIRVCMFTGAGVWEAGSWDEGCAADLMRRRKELGAEHIKIIADVDKKHSVRFPGIDLATHIEWTRFSGADPASTITVPHSHNSALRPVSSSSSRFAADRTFSPLSM